MTKPDGVRGFEEFLQDIHARDYTGNGDDMGEAFDDWLQDLQADDWIKYAEQWKSQAEAAIREYLAGELEDMKKAMPVHIRNCVCVICAKNGLYNQAITAAQRLIRGEDTQP